ncbi:ABC-2 type transport system permease protein [Anaerosolibacter carboniphilus]|uniref:ABC-2 type transport system permease protein n=1 Tax=Anaerosolibacter carboniphilus TaxID=1417629 RepID=A0A841KR44_9FIRM|nr:ABC-2 family transporter protein [Anaerosolibacter carboniphilus]MBB6215887.1 ABC-2 type transport system permease protein [Anaerosolibacter carboniphilus]
MKLYLRYCSIILRSQMQYKSSFFMTILGQFLVSFSMFISIYFMFKRFNRVEGFSYSEVLLCFAIVLTSFSIAECFIRGFDAFSGIISNGEFDRIMVRPRNEIIQVLGSKIEFTRIGRFLQAVIIFFYAIPASEVIWTFDKIVTLVFMIVGGICIFAGLFVIYASLCFFTIEGLEFINIFTDGGREFGKYPLLIYGEGVLKFFTYIIPLALVQYYPLTYLIGRTDNKLFILLPLIGALFLIPCYIFWRFGLKHYKSTGS